MLMPDRQAVLRDAVDQLLDAVGRGEVRSPSDCVRVLREMTEPRPCAGCGQPRVEPQEPCPHCDLGNVVPVTAEDLLGSVPPGDLRIHVPGLGEQSLHPRAEVLRLREQVADALAQIRPLEAQVERLSCLLLATLPDDCGDPDCEHHECSLRRELEARP